MVFLVLTSNSAGSIFSSTPPFSHTQHTHTHGADGLHMQVSVEAKKMRVEVEEH